MIKTRRTKRASSPELNSKLSSLHALSRGAAGIRVISQMYARVALMQAGS